MAATAYVEPAGAGLGCGDCLVRVSRSVGCCGFVVGGCLVRVSRSVGCDSCGSMNDRCIVIGL